jgi:voltage-dependent calcium channel
MANQVDIPRPSPDLSVSLVNFATFSFEDEGHVRLGTDDGDERVGENNDDGVEKMSETLSDSSSSILPLRGRTLGLFGPTNRVRLTMYGFLIFPSVAFFPTW